MCVCNLCGIQSHDIHRLLPKCVWGKTCTHIPHVRTDIDIDTDTGTDTDTDTGIDTDIGIDRA